MLSEIMAAVRETSKLIRSADVSKTAIREKTSKRDLCTAYDMEVQAQLIDRLSKLLPEAQFIGEEKQNLPLSTGWCFVIDPIDGTANFVCDYRHSAISVALLKDMVPVIGVVYDPYLDELFYAQQGNGAFLNGHPIHISNGGLADSLVGFGTSPYDREESRQAFALIGRVFEKSLDIRRSGSAALDLCYVAAGRLGLFFEMSLRPWDFAAGGLIVSEAGGKISTVDGTSLDYRRVCSVLAGSEAARDDFMALLQE